MNGIRPLVSRRSGRHHRPYFRRTRAVSAVAVALALAALHVAAVKEIPR